jgi:hypothetical protein
MTIYIYKTVLHIYIYSGLTVIKKYTTPVLLFKTTAHLAFLDPIEVVTFFWSTNFMGASSAPWSKTSSQLCAGHPSKKWNPKHTGYINMWI